MDHLEPQDTPEYTKLQAAYSKHLEDVKGALKAINEDPQFRDAMKEHAARLGVAMPRLDVGQITGEICKDWPRVKGFLNFAISMAAFWPGVSVIAAGAKAIVAMVDSQLMPMICKAP